MQTFSPQPMRALISNKSNTKDMIHSIHLFLAWALVAFISCNNDDSNECAKSRTTYVTSVNAPDKGNTREPILIEVNFGVINGCGQFGKFIESANGNIRTIEVEAEYVGCMCTQNAPIRTTQYEFAPPHSGSHTLRFKSGDTDFIEVSLEIND